MKTSFLPLLLLSTAVSFAALAQDAETLPAVPETIPDQVVAPAPDTQTTPATAKPAAKPAATGGVVVNDVYSPAKAAELKEQKEEEPKEPLKPVAAEEESEPKTEIAKPKVEPKPEVAAPPAEEVKVVGEPEELSIEEAKNETTPLRRALAAAYLSNPELQAQREAQQAVDERVPQALSGVMPTAQADYSNGRRRSDAGQGWEYFDAKTKQLTVSQPVFRGGRTWATTKASRREVDAGQARLLQVEQNVLLEAVTAYMDVVQASAVVDLNKNNVEVLGKQLEATQQRFDVGEDTRTDVAQSQARQASAQSSLVEAQSQLEASKAAYEKVTGLKPDNISMPESLPELPKDLEEVTKIALANNPQVDEVGNLKEAADYGIYARAGALLPSVNLVGSMRRQEGASVFLDEVDTDDVLLNVSIPLYQSGAEYSRVREAQQNYQQRRFQELDISNEVRRQAVAAWEDLQSARSTLVSNQSAIDAAEIALEGTRQEQQFGARTTLDVLDAEQELFVARVNFVGSQRNEVVAAYRLLSILGQLTAENLNLRVSRYDAEENLDDVEYQFIGF